MARREQTGGGGTRRRGSGAGTGRRGHKAKKSRHLRAKAHTTHHAAHAIQHTARATTSGAEHPAAGSAWRSGSAGIASPMPLLTLSADLTQREEALALVGAQQGALSEALRAWSAESDRAANRAWRRPGGLQRMAGL